MEINLDKLTGLRILVADDQYANRLILKHYIERWNSEGIYAENGQEVLAILNQDNNIHLIIIDLNMPGIDGIEVTKKIRQGFLGEEVKQIPIIALTGDILLDKAKLKEEIKFNEILIKPFNPNELLNIIKEFCLEIKNH